MDKKERKRKEALLKRLHIAIIHGKQNGYCKAPDDQKADFEIKLAKLCVRYNNLKKELGI